MIYFRKRSIDTSALVKMYILETGSQAVLTMFQSGSQAGTAAITQVEMASAIAKAVRSNAILEPDGHKAWNEFRADWGSFFRISLSEVILDRAADLAWEFGLRSYDAVHLASALILQETINEPVVLATFDRQLHQAARQSRLSAWPDAL